MELKSAIHWDVKTYKITESNIEYDVIEYSNGDKCWFYKGKYHRELGPAVMSKDGLQQYYWLDGIFYSNVNSPEELLIASIIK